MTDRISQTILVVDDDDYVRRSIARLVQAMGYDVEQSGAGEDAVERIRDTRFDCVLLDVRMPGMDGMAVLSRVRAKNELLPVIMVTADEEINTAVGCMRHGAYDYVVKPVRKIVLLEAIVRAVRHREVLLENRRLTEENAQHRRYLEEQVELRTRELRLAYHQMKQTNFDTVRVLAETIEAKDSYTRGHCNRVHILSRTLAQYLEFESEEIVAIEYGALLHDIGKIGVPESILNKPGRLTESEFTVLKRHTLVGEQILKPLAFFQSCLPIVRNHHERYDGAGYPDRIAGKSIAPSARVVAIADAYDAMATTRSYRAAMREDAAVDQIREGMGKQFDPHFARVFLEREVYRTVSASVLRTL